MRKSERMKKVLSALLCLCMLVQYVPTTAFAVTTAEDGLCEHHPEHTAECHYAEAVSGSPCTHAHSEDCYAILECLHTCTEDCDDPCTHQCTVNNGCITMDLLCSHKDGGHDDTCGYVAAVEAHECHYECVECAAALTADETTTPSTEATTEPSTEETEPAPACDCGTDDAAIHATTCAVYVAPEMAVCYCTEKCSDINIWCDICGFDYTACIGTDSAVAYADGITVEITGAGGNTMSVTLQDADGDGYYDISIADELYAFAAAVNGGNGSINGELIKDIVVNENVLNEDGDLNGDGSNFRVWTPIGWNWDPYGGTFDGNGHTVSGLYFNDPTADDVGLFGDVLTGTIGDKEYNGAVQNVGVVDSYLSGRYKIGGVVGTNEYSTIQNCYNAVTLSGSQNVGGVVGFNVNGTIQNCYNEAAVSGNYYIGGVAGDNSGTITGCYNTGTVDGDSCVGGVVGDNSSSGSITDCHNTGAVTGTGNDVGGVVGDNSSSGSITDCHNTGAVTGTGNNVGGVVGDNSGSITDCHNTGTVTGTSGVGGVVGYNYDGKIADCYNTAPVTGTGNYVGGVVGNSKGTITVCHNIGAVNGTEYVGGVVGDNGSNGKVTNCYNSGTVDGTGYYVGGVVGNNDDGTITECYNEAEATVTGTSGVGGVVGWNKGTITNCYNTATVTGTSDVGGVVGDNGSNSKVTNCYNSGIVTGNRRIGGVAGNNDGTLTNSYNTGTVNGTSSVGGVAGRNDETVTNCYYLTGTAAGGINGQDAAGQAEAKTADQFASGEVAYLLQSGVTIYDEDLGEDTTEGAPHVWGQNINNGETVQPLPVLSDARVYYGYPNCNEDASPVYTNDARATEQPGHGGGTATCTELAVCQKCNILYGEKDMDNHTGTLSAPVLTDDGTKHVATWSCCGGTVTEDHTYVYTLNETGNTITVSCSANCSYEETATISAEDAIYTGSAYAGANVAYSDNWPGDRNLAITYAVKDGETLTEAPKNAGTYTASIKFSGVTASVEFTIEKANAEVPTGLTAYYGQTLANVTLADGWSWVDATASVGEVGNQTHKANYAGSQNYKAADNVDVTVTVSQSGAVMTATADKSEYTYGETVTITVSGITPTGAAPAVNTFALTAPIDNQVAIWNGETQLTEPQVVNGDALTFTVTGLNVGEYTLTAKFTGNTNMAAAAANVTFVINNATLTVMADNKTMCVGNARPELTYTITGFVSGDSEDMLTTKPTISCEADGTTAGTYDITVSGAMAENYSISYVPGLLSVNSHSTAAEGDRPATCKELAYCSVCESEYGELAAHSTAAEGDKAATCTAKAYCSVCESEYGDFDLNNHDTSAEYDNGFCKNCDAYEPATLNENTESAYYGYYEIESAGQLFWFAQQVNGGAIENTSCAVLIDGIDLKSRAWTPITNFSGTFDGAGYEIKNFAMNITAKGDYGLFGFVNDATIKDFTIYGEVESTLTAKPDDFKYGVIADATGDTTITDVHSYVNFTIKDSYFRNFVGGILGRINNAGANFAIERCSFSGTLNLGAAQVDCTGGIVAYIFADNIVKINNCLFDGEINSTYNSAMQVGGLLGYYRGSGLTVTNSLSIGGISVSNKTLYGALIGILRQHSSANQKVTNNYYLEGDQPFGNSTNSDDITDGHGSQTVAGSATAATEDQLKSGEIAYLLQGEQETHVWGQTIGTEAPTLGGAKVYYGYTDCREAAAMVYSNDSTVSETKPGHSGGTATCSKQAICESCGEPYGELDSTNHDETVSFDANGFCPNNCDVYEPAVLVGDYYEIGNAGQLYWFAQQVNGGNTAINGELTADIVVNENVLDANGDLNDNGSNFRVWTPIGLSGSSSRYIGNFDGGNHTVSGLYFNDNSVAYVGLFGATDGATIKNVGVVDSWIFARLRVGGIVGSGYGTTILNCYNTGTLTSENNNTVESDIGGIVGSARDSVVVNCYNAGKIKGNKIYTGGVVGDAYYDSVGCIVENCYNVGTVSGTGSVGGIVGVNSYGIVTNCYNIGTVNGNSDTGALIGYNGSKGNVTNCYYLAGNAGIGYNGPSGNAVISEITEAQVKAASGEDGALVDMLNAWVAEQNDVKYKGWHLCSNDTPSLNLVYTYSDNGENHVVKCGFCGETTEAHTFDSATGKCQFCKVNVAEAKVTLGGVDTYYETLDGAISAVASATAADEAVVKLLRNIDLGTASQTISSGVFTLDLNDCEVKTSGNQVLYISGGSVTITDSGEDKLKGTIINTKSYVVCGVYVDGANASVTISGGTIESTSDFSRGVYITNEGTVTITDGTITGGYYGVLVEGGTLTISNNATIRVTNSQFESIAVDIFKGTANISGGTITCTTGHSVFAGATASIIITGGDFRGKYGVSTKEGGTVTITGGAITGTNADLYFQNKRGTIKLDLDENGIGASFPNGITTSGSPLEEILSDGASYWAGGTMLTQYGESGITDKGTIAIKATCTHENATYAPGQDNTTHTLNCADCNNSVVEAHTPDVNSYNASGNVITVFCIDCGATSGTATITAEDRTYDGTVYVATVIKDGTLADAEVAVTYCCEGGCINAGEHTASITLGDATVTVDFIIEKRELTLKLTDCYKEYDGTNILTQYTVELENAISDDVGVDESKLTVTLSGVVPGTYATAKVSGISLTGETAGNYTLTEALENVLIFGYYGNPFEIEKATVTVTSLNQTVEPEAELDQSCYTVKRLPQGHTLSGVVLEKDGDRIAVKTENIVITDANGVNVTDYFNIDPYDSGIIYETCVGHTFNADGFCATGQCQVYETPKLNDNGTEEEDDDYYEIRNAGQLFWFAEYVNDVTNEVDAKLMNNITVPAGMTWNPIMDFYGTFDGNFKTVSGLNVTGDTNVGMFGGGLYARGTIKNLGLTNSHFEGSSYVGGIAGYHEGTIENCYVDGSVTVVGESITGMLVGNNAGTVRNCYAYGSSFVGRFNNSNGSIENCYFLSDTEDSFDGTTAMTAEAFASGEVAYRLQSGIVGEPLWDEENDDYFYDDEGNYIYGEAPHIWGQTIGIEQYPVLKGKKVYFDENADPQYYNEKSEIISVDITWGAMSFTYTDGEWNPETHTYGEGKWTPDDENGNVITVKNNGNAAVNVTFTYTKTVTEVEGSFTIDGTNGINEVALAVGKEEEIYLLLTGKPNETNGYVTLGTITVTITTGGE